MPPVNTLRVKVGAGVSVGALLPHVWEGLPNSDMGSRGRVDTPAGSALSHTHTHTLT